MAADDGGRADGAAAPGAEAVLAVADSVNGRGAAAVAVAALFVVEDHDDLLVAFVPD